MPLPLTDITFGLKAKHLTHLQIFIAFGTILMMLEADEVFLFVPERAIFGKSDRIEDLGREPFRLEFSCKLGR